ncbi:hypothetical protein HZH66_013005 [Vespula vulgaris]|uniref:Uncharacterized protein n=1 Tax=Vespula vulgaris TaxID=7454 RepID=A0A834MSJ2_VESVU|nr:hypothetical protein HZH66_013005 [Vespula vulgaris]
MMSPFLTMAHPLGIKGDELLNISKNGTSVKLPEIDLSEVGSLPGDLLKLPTTLISGSDMKYEKSIIDPLGSSNIVMERKKEVRLEFSIKVS